MSKLIVPQWPLPKGVAACSSTRIGGVSLPPYAMSIIHISEPTRPERIGVGGVGG